MTKEETEKEEETAYKLVKIPTGEQLAIQTPDEQIWTFEQAVFELLNKVDKLEKLM